MTELEIWQQKISTFIGSVDVTRHYLWLEPHIQQFLNEFAESTLTPDQKLDLLFGYPVPSNTFEFKATGHSFATWSLRFSRQAPHALFQFTTTQLNAGANPNEWLTRFKPNDLLPPYKMDGSEQAKALYCYFDLIEWLMSNQTIALDKKLSLLTTPFANHECFVQAVLHRIKPTYAPADDDYAYKSVRPTMIMRESNEAVDPSVDDTQFTRVLKLLNTLLKLGASEQTVVDILRSKVMVEEKARVEHVPRERSSSDDEDDCPPITLRKVPAQDVATSITKWVTTVVPKELMTELMDWLSQNGAGVMRKLRDEIAAAYKEHTTPTYFELQYLDNHYQQIIDRELPQSRESANDPTVIARKRQYAEDNPSWEKLQQLSTNGMSADDVVKKMGANKRIFVFRYQSQFFESLITPTTAKQLLARLPTPALENILHDDGYSASRSWCAMRNWSVDTIWQVQGYMSAMRAFLKAGVPASDLTEQFDESDGYIHSTFAYVVAGYGTHELFQEYLALARDLVQAGASRKYFPALNPARVLDQNELASLVNSTQLSNRSDLSEKPRLLLSLLTSGFVPDTAITALAESSDTQWQLCEYILKLDYPKKAIALKEFARAGSTLHTFFHHRFGFFSRVLPLSLQGETAAAHKLSEAHQTIIANEAKQAATAPAADELLSAFRIRRPVTTAPAAAAARQVNPIAQRQPVVHIQRPIAVRNQHTVGVQHQPPMAIAAVPQQPPMANQAAPATVPQTVAGAATSTTSATQRNSSAANSLQAGSRSFGDFLAPATPKNEPVVETATALKLPDAPQHAVGENPAASSTAQNNNLAVCEPN